MTPGETLCFKRLLAKAPAGPRLELGVYRGGALQLMRHAGELYGVDSFEGMPEPSERDVKDGWNPYPKGRLAAAAPRVSGATLIKGWIPQALDKLPDRPWAFVHVDLDQYDSTLSALQWLFIRMAPRGILCCDDWFADRDWLAGGAINQQALQRPLTGTCERKAWWVF